MFTSFHTIGIATGSLLALMLLPIAAHADEPVTVLDILAAPTIYHLRQTKLQGTVRNVQPLDPYETPSGSRCYGGYLFLLDDDTAVMTVAVTGFCGIPLVKDPDVEDGQRVIVDATIQAPSHGGYALSLKGLKITTEEEGLVQAIANRITPLPE